LAVKHITTSRNGVKADPDVMAAIAMASSGGKFRESRKRGDGSVTRGLWQISSVHGFADLDLFDADDNARAAARVYARGGYAAWGSYSSGAYAEHMPENVYPPGVGATGFTVNPVDAVKGIPDAIRGGVNALTETVMRATVSAGAMVVAVTLLVLGVAILIRPRGQSGVKAAAGAASTAAGGAGKAARAVRAAR
jgi:hypothetical protein